MLTHSSTSATFSLLFLFLFFLRAEISLKVFVNPVKAAAEAQKQKITNLFCVGVSRTAALVLSTLLLSETERRRHLLMFISKEKPTDGLSAQTHSDNCGNGKQTASSMCGIINNDSQRYSKNARRCCMSAHYTLTKMWVDCMAKNKWTPNHCNQMEKRLTSPRMWRQPCLHLLAIYDQMPLMNPNSRNLH